MRSWTRSRLLLATTATAVVAAMALQGGAAVADPPNGRGPGHDQGNHFGRLKPTGPDYNHGKPLPVSRQESEKVHPAHPDHPVRVGQTRSWPALDDYRGRIYLKSYKLRGIGDHIEVWVAKDTSFPSGDCRNDLGLTDITDAQVRSFVKEFDSNIYPTESEAFSVPPNRDGSNALLAKHYQGLPRTQFEGDGDNIVVLVDNVRDANYYAPTTPSGQTYIAGFFYSIFNEYTDRNVMTIDAYDWLHRTGANPPDDSGDPAYQACADQLGAGSLGNPRPHLYEGTFAHEYQHLLEYYEDPDEVSWVNEGLSDYAQTQVGYVDPSVPVDDPAADSHIACFSGFMADRGYGGPENSLTAWEDQGGPEVLCDYGAAYSFMQYLAGHYGEGFMSALHREDANGLEGLQNQLTAAGSTDSAMDVVHKWAATMALDNVVDGGATLTGGAAGDYSEGTLGAQVNWQAVYGDINHDGTADDTGNEAFSTPGAPMNGSDYVRLGDGPVGNRTFFSADQVDSLTFDAPAGLPSTPVRWTVDQTPPSGTSADLTCGQDGTATGAPGTADDPALYSGCGANMDRAIVRTVTVPADDPTLTFRSLWDTEEGWDFGFVQVYDPTADGGDGGYVSVSCTSTTTDVNPSAQAAAKDNLPGYTGTSDGWQDESCDLGKYAGQSVDLAFRYITDPAANEAGWWVDDVAVGGQQVSDGTDLDAWQSGTEAHPTPVEGFTVQLVAYDSDGSAAWVGQVPVTEDADGFHGELSGDALHQVIGTSADTVAALVMQDDPTESVSQYAPYTLTVNGGVVQPGGGPA